MSHNICTVMQVMMQGLEDVSSDSTQNTPLYSDMNSGLIQEEEGWIIRGRCENSALTMEDVLVSYTSDQR